MTDIEIRFCANQPNVVSEVIDGEAIIINLENGAYYSLQGSGALIWRAIENRASLAEIVNHMHGAYQVERAILKQAAQELVADLQKEKLITISTESSPIDHENLKFDGDQGQFNLPKLYKYEDMAELLLLDPIHEVDESGWPNVKSQ